MEALLSPSFWEHGVLFSQWVPVQKAGSGSEIEQNILTFGQGGVSASWAYLLDLFWWYKPC